MILINWKFIKIRKRKRKKEDRLRVFYFKYLIKMFSYDLILEVDYINT